MAGVQVDYITKPVPGDPEQVKRWVEDDHCREIEEYNHSTIDGEPLSNSQYKISVSDGDHVQDVNGFEESPVKYGSWCHSVIHAYKPKHSYMMLTLAASMSVWLLRFEKSPGWYLFNLWFLFAPFLQLLFFACLGKCCPCVMDYICKSRDVRKYLKSWGAWSYSNSNTGYLIQFTEELISRKSFQNQRAARQDFPVTVPRSVQTGQTQSEPEWVREIGFQKLSEYYVMCNFDEVQKANKNEDGVLVQSLSNEFLSITIKRVKKTYENVVRENYFYYHVKDLVTGDTYSEHSEGTGNPEGSCQMSFQELQDFLVNYLIHGNACVTNRSFDAGKSINVFDILHNVNRGKFLLYVKRPRDKLLR